MVRDRVCTSRLGAYPQQQVDDAKLRGLVAALVVNDLAAARLLLEESQGCFFNSRVTTQWGGQRVFPIEALVAGPAGEGDKCQLARRLWELGASVNVAWREAAGEHTPLSRVRLQLRRALSLRHFRLASTLLECGASPSTALLETSLLECCRFDPAVVRWLLDAGADVSVPAHHSPRPCLGSAGSISATVMVLGKCGVQLHMLRQLSSIHATPSSLQAQAVLQRTAHILAMLLTAGAPPLRVGTQRAGSPPSLPLPNHVALVEAAAAATARERLDAASTSAPAAALGGGEAAAAAGGGLPCSVQPLEPAFGQLHLGPASPAPPARSGSPPPAGLSREDWELLRPYATQVPRWSRRLHHLFPRPVREAIRELLLISRCRGFGGGSTSGSAGRSSDTHTAPCREGQQQQQQQCGEGGRVWLDGHVVECIMQQAAAVWFRD